MVYTANPFCLPNTPSYLPLLVVEGGKDFRKLYTAFRSLSLIRLNEFHGKTKPEQRPRITELV
jgi:hypothetical protein